MVNTAIANFTEEVRIQRLVQVLEHQVSNGGSIATACAATGLAESTFYSWLKKGILDEYLAQVKDSRVSAIQAQSTLALPDVIKYMIALATGQDEARGASPIRAAELVLKIAGVSAASPGPGAAPNVNILNLLPQQVNFGQMTGGQPALDNQGRIIVPSIEIIEGGVVVVED